jgi:hypothetical protein
LSYDFCRRIGQEGLVGREVQLPSDGEGWIAISLAV